MKIEVVQLRPRLVVDAETFIKLGGSTDGRNIIVDDETYFRLWWALWGSAWAKIGTNAASALYWQLEDDKRRQIARWALSAEDAQRQALRAAIEARTQARTTAERARAARFDPSPECPVLGLRRSYLDEVLDARSSDPLWDEEMPLNPSLRMMLVWETAERT